jgi:putative FmdB family regulatory protein
MPVYEYECPACGDFTQFRPMSDSRLPAECPQCRADAKRIFSAPFLALMNPVRRQASVRNEQSMHAPRVGWKSACGCISAGCRHKKRPAAEKVTRNGRPALQQSTKKNRRPWMLGH